MNRTLTLLQPRRLVFGSGCLADCIRYLTDLKQLHIIASPSQTHVVQQVADQLTAAGCTVSADCTLSGEPTIAVFEAALARARDAHPHAIVGIGGGSPLDVAKLAAAFLDSDQPLHETFGINLLQARSCPLICVPTTSGTGSEVSPNAILLDEAARLKKGVVSPHLVPDATFIDPTLTLTMPAAVTAFTGLDALTHCIEAYTNRFAHPLVDVYALEGIALCSQWLARAVAEPNNLEAREAMSLVSLYGGLCLGPVNTAAVHALAYPLGGEYHLAHGLANALLLPHVFRFNAEAAPARHAAVAHALGVARAGDDLTTAYAAADYLEALSAACGLVCDLTRHGVPRTAIPALARAAMTVTRLLRNNPRELAEADCIHLYERCFLHGTTNLVS